MTVIEIHKTDETESKYDWKSAGPTGLIWKSDWSQETATATAQINCVGLRWYWFLLVGHQSIARGHNQDFLQVLTDAEAAIDEHVTGGSHEALRTHLLRAEQTLKKFLKTKQKDPSS